MIAIQTSKQSWARWPMGPVRIRWGHSQAHGLVSACHPVSSHGMVDLVDVTQLSVVNGAHVQLVFSLPMLACPTSNASARVTAPQRVRLPWPVTWMCWSYVWSWPSAYASFGGVTHNNTNSTPYVAYGLDASAASNTYYVVCNSNGTLVGKNSGVTIVRSAFTHVAVVFTVGARYLYLDGRLVFSDVWVISNPTYGSAAMLHVGESWTSQNRALNGFVGDMRIYRRALSREEIVDMIHPRNRYALYDSVPTRTVIDLSVTPQRVLH